MNRQTEALIELDEFLKKWHISYAVIGGIAVQWWGEARFTHDIDITIVVEIGEERNTCLKIAEGFRLRLSDGIEYALKNRILLIYAANDSPIDISIGFLDYERELIGRGIECEIVRDTKIKICSPEDLAVIKLVAGRPRDIEDVAGIFIRQKRGLDIDYIRKWLGEFARALDRRKIIETFETLRKEHYE